MVFSSSPLPQWLVPSAGVSFDSMVLELNLLGYLLFVRQRSKELMLTLPRCLAPNSDNLLTYGWKLSWPETFCLVLGPQGLSCRPNLLCFLRSKAFQMQRLNLWTGRRCPNLWQCKRQRMTKAQFAGKPLVTAEHLWRRFGHRWQSGPGSHLLPSHVGGPCRRHVWLEWRTGGMGCSLCHWFKFWQTFQESKGRSRPKRFCTKWGRFGIKEVASMQSSAIRLHSCSEVHKTAWQSFCNPTLAPKLVALSDFVRWGCSFAEEWRAASQRLASLVQSCDKYFAQPAFFAGIVLHRQFCLLWQGRPQGSHQRSLLKYDQHFRWPDSRRETCFHRWQKCLVSNEADFPNRCSIGIDSFPWNNTWC